jgi:hypothetical protein
MGADLELGWPGEQKVPDSIITAAPGGGDRSFDRNAQHHAALRHHPANTARARRVM